MFRKLIFLILLLLSGNESCNTRSGSQTDVCSYTTYNLDFEYVSENSIQPARWQIADLDLNGYQVSIDATQKQHGKLSLKLVRIDTTGKWGFFCQNLPNTLVANKEIELSGWIKTKDVRDGIANLYIYNRDNSDIQGYMLEDPNGIAIRNTTDWTKVSVRRKIGDSVNYVTIGGVLKGDGTAWFDNLTLTIDGIPVQDTLLPTPKIQFTQQEEKELRKYVYPLRTYEPDQDGTADLDILPELIGVSHVVALGENTHGSSEVFQMKDRLIRYLAAQMDFDIFSIEANMPESYRLDEYIKEGKGDPRQLIAGMYFWTWNTQEMLSLVEWMRRFNTPQPKISYTGFDMQSYEGPVAELREAFKNDKEAEILIMDIVSGLKFSKSHSEEQSVDTAVTIPVEQLEKRINFLETHENRKEWLRQNITLLKQYAGNVRYGLRDRFMADNLAWIKSQNPLSKIIIWAHNGHIMKTDHVMGEHLNEKFGDDYLTFGFTFYDGSYLAVGERGLSAYTAQCAYPGTLEYLLAQLDEPIFILDLKKIKTDNSPIMEWINDLQYRFIGGAQAKDEFFIHRITDDFDYLIYIKESTPSHILQQ